MQPKVVFTTVMSVSLLFCYIKGKPKRKVHNAILCYFAIFMFVTLRINDFRLAAECYVSFTLSGQARYHDTQVDTRGTATRKYKFLCILKSII
jgi:hypothetical protein